MKAREAYSEGRKDKDLENEPNKIKAERHRGGRVRVTITGACPHIDYTQDGAYVARYVLSPGFAQRAADELSTVSRETRPSHCPGGRTSEQLMDAIGEDVFNRLGQANELLNDPEWVARQGGLRAAQQYVSVHYLWELSMVADMRLCLAVRREFPEIEDWRGVRWDIIVLAAQLVERQRAERRGRSDVR